MAKDKRKEEMEEIFLEEPTSYYRFKKKRGHWLVEECSVESPMEGARVVAVKEKTERDIYLVTERKLVNFAKKEAMSHG